MKEVFKEIKVLAVKEDFKDFKEVTDLKELLGILDLDLKGLLGQEDLKEHLLKEIKVLQVIEVSKETTETEVPKEVL